MEVIQAQPNPAGKNFVGQCCNCKSTFRAKHDELHWQHDQREGWDWAHTDCSVCGHKMSVTFVERNTEPVKIKTVKLKEISVYDADSGMPVEITIYKMANGPMIGIDSSFLANTDDDVISPYDGKSVLEID